MTLAERLATFAAGLAYADIPAAVTESVRLRILDILGLGLAASTSDVAPSLQGALEGWASRGDCTVINAKLTAAAPLAILMNGALAHALDFDDTHAASITHASAVVVPTVLTLGEAGAVDGRTVITAAVAGYEAIARLGMAASGAFHDRGWHASAVCGTFAAALAAGKCEGLDAPRLTAALGIAGSFASGLMEFLEDGSWVKRVHPGWAGHSSAVAAALARGGFSGPASILEGRFGFYQAFLGRAPDAAPYETLGREWETLRVSFKPYPCCHLAHAVIDCALELRRAHRLAPDDIEGVECLVPAGEVPIICEPREAKVAPRTRYDAQFSLPFTVAAALVDGRLGLETFAVSRLRDERVLALAARVRHRVDADARYPDTFPGWVRLRLRDGRTVEARQADPRGGPARPLPPGAVVEKFRENAGAVLPAARIEEIEQAVLGLDTRKDAGDVMRLCRG
jgi:2-methylcitrate dehydratase PrpD